MTMGKDVGQALHGITWGSVDGTYADYRDGRFAWLKQVNFGIFIHWGIYSLLEGEWKDQEFRGVAEWIMRMLQIPVKDYEELAKQFNPVKFSADEWLDLFKEAGAQYVTITSKHHDGFCMFDSDVDDFNVVKGTAYGKDIIKEMSAACFDHGLRLCLYYSQDQDWHEPQASGNNWDFPAENRFPEGRRQYVDSKVIPQLKELLTKYGPVGYIWFDTPGYLSKEEARSIKETVLGLQPECMSSSRLGHDLGDFESLPDQMVPKTINQHRCETAMTHNDSWAYSRFDTNWKSPETIIRQLVETVSCGAKYLFNIGPRFDGSIPVESVNALRKVGQWLKLNGESIYGCLPNPLGARLPWGVCTAKPGKIYIHVMEPPLDGKLFLPYSGAVSNILLLADGTELSFERKDDRITVNLPDVLPDKAVSVLVMKLPSEAVNCPMLLPNQKNYFQADRFMPDADVAVARISWMHETFGNWHHSDILSFGKNGSHAEIRVNAVADGNYRIFLEYNFAPADTTQRNTLDGRESILPVTTETCYGCLKIDEQIYEITLPYVTPGYFETKQVCELELMILQGTHDLVLTAGCDGFPEIVSLQLIPVFAHAV